MLPDRIGTPVFGGVTAPSAALKNFTVYGTCGVFIDKFVGTACTGELFNSKTFWSLKIYRSVRLVTTAVALAALAAAAQSATVFSLADNGTSLVRFDSATPGAVSVVGTISGAAGGLNGLDFRPVNGVLYGYQKSSGGIYSVDTSTGVTTFVSTPTAPVGSALLGLDFNPVVDRLRLVTANDENRRINTISGATTTDGAFAYAVGDVNFGSNPNLVDAGYTNSDRNVATGTQLFYTDYVLDALVGTTSPNGGILNTVGSLDFDTDRFCRIRHLHRRERLEHRLCVSAGRRGRGLVHGQPEYRRCIIGGPNQRRPIVRSRRRCRP